MGCCLSKEMREAQLREAARDGDCEMVKRLITKGVDVNAKVSEKKLSISDRANAHREISKHNRETADSSTMN